MKEREVLLERSDGSLKTAFCRDSSLIIDGTAINFIGYESPLEVKSKLLSMGTAVNHILVEYIPETDLKIQIITHSTRAPFGEEVSI